MKNKVFVLSDIHLEGKSSQSQKFILNTINSLLAIEKKKGVSPILAITGDVHNGNNGISWLEKINAPIIYVGGNHEYWQNDYYETIELLSNTVSKNVNFLHNDCIEMNEHIFVGSTMWTDVGLSLNPDLVVKSNDLMNDRYEITCKKWYQNESNIELLKKTFPKSACMMIEKKQWNVLVEIEENQKTITYLNNFGLLIDILREAKIELTNLERIKDYFKSTPSSLEEYKIKKNTLTSYKNKSFSNWFNDCKKLGLFIEHDNHPINLTNFEDIEIIFNKVKLMNIDNPIVVVSHHLPFIEERLIGKQDWHKNNKHKLLNKLKEDIYNVTKGITYPDGNYFYNISKGYYHNKDEAITHVIHYSNNGSKNLDNCFLKNVHSWLHGHEHHYNYQDFLKGINIATNPLGYSMAVFVIEEDNIQLSKSYKDHYKINPDVEKKEVKNLLNSFLRPVITSFSNNEEKEELIKLWILKNMDWEKYNNYYKTVTILNKKLLNYLIRRPQISLGKYTSKDQLEIEILANAIDFNIDKLNKYKQEIVNAVAIRLDPNYSFSNKLINNVNGFNILNILNNNLSDNFYLKGNYKLHSLQHYIDYASWTEEYIQHKYENLVNNVFDNLVILKEDEKRAEIIQKSLNKIENKYIYQYEVNEIKSFYDEIKIIRKDDKYDEDYAKKLNEKKKETIDKYKTEQYYIEEKQKAHKSHLYF